VSAARRTDGARDAKRSTVIVHHPHIRRNGDMGWHTFRPARSAPGAFHTETTLAVVPFGCAQRDRRVDVAAVLG
jgi:hypothetical protein